MNASHAIRVALIMKMPGNVRVMEQVLSGNGIHAKGISGEDELAQLLDEDFIPDVTLLDVSGMGASAWRICETLQARQLPFIVLSPAGQPEPNARSLQYGARGILQKPIGKNALLQLIQSFVN